MRKTIRPSTSPRRGQALSSAAAALAFLASSACSVFGIRTVEEASYEIVEKQGAFEVRQYPELVVVETLVPTEVGTDRAENKAFFRLFDYIRGENQESRKIDMTAPVLIENEGQTIAMTAPVLRQDTAGGMKMSFVLPADFDAESAPAPKDPAVKLRVLERARIASLRYSGSRSQKAFEGHADELQRWLADQGFEAASEARYAGYDPPFTIPFFRRHEVWIELL